jgi:hypothetical protein
MQKAWMPFLFIDAEIAQKGHFRMETNYYLEMLSGILYKCFISLYSSILEQYKTQKTFLIFTQKRREIPT